MISTGLISTVLISTGLISTGLVSTAQAHTPHDATLHAAAHPDDPDRLVTSIGRAGFWFLLVSDDGGLTWDTRAVPSAGAGVTDAAWWGDELLLTTAGGGLLIGDGRSWSRVDEVTDDALTEVSVEGGVALVAGDRIWREDGEGWRLVAVAPEPTAALARRGDVACVGTEAGWLGCSEDGGLTWSERAALESGLFDLSVDSDGDALAATESGLYRVDRAGGVSALDVPPPARAVAAFDDGLVLAGSDEVVWRSTDSGASFAAVSEGLEPPDPYNNLRYGHYRGFSPAGGDILLSAWEGLHRSSDGGRTWTHLQTMGPQWHLDVHVLAGPQLMMASYGGGSLSRLSADGGFEITGATSRATHLRISDVSPGYLEDGIAWIGERGNLWGTTDAGDDWVDVTDAGPFVASVEAVAVQRDGFGAAVVLAGGEADDRLALAWSDDGGRSFVRAPVDDKLGDELRSVFAVAFSPDFAADGRMYAAVAAGDGAAILRSVGGGTFEVMDTVDTRPLRLVFSDPDTLWAPSPEGLLGWSGDDRLPALLAGEWVSDALFVDGRIFAALPDAVVRSDDGGETWATLDWDPGASVLDLAASDEAPGVLAAASPTGAWLSGDLGETWARASARQRLDVAAHAWSLDPGWSQDGSYWASMLQQATARERGGRATFRFEGVEAGLYALSNGDQGRLSVSVDGGEPTTVRLRSSSALGSTLVWCEGMEPGWHEIVVEAERLPVQLDAMEIMAETGSGVRSVCEGWEPPSCGCAARAGRGGGRSDGRGVLAAGLVMLAAVSRRRP